MPKPSQTEEPRTETFDPLLQIKGTVLWCNMNMKISLLTSLLSKPILQHYGLQHILNRKNLRKRFKFLISKIGRNPILFYQKIYGKKSSGMNLGISVFYGTFVLQNQNFVRKCLTCIMNYCLFHTPMWTGVRQRNCIWYTLESVVKTHCCYWSPMNQLTFHETAQCRHVIVHAPTKRLHVEVGGLRWGSGGWMWDWWLSPTMSGRWSRWCWSSLRVPMVEGFLCSWSKN